MRPSAQIKFQDASDSTASPLFGIRSRSLCEAFCRCLLVLLALCFAHNVSGLASSSLTVEIPQIAREPLLEDFLGMEPPADLANQLAHVEGFTQQEPRDGNPSSQKTVVYMGYDERQLYFVFVAFEDDPSIIRSRLARRENIRGDDLVEVMLDTFNDQRRAYAFLANPRGVQLDGLYTEGQGFDFSFDTLWHSNGAQTEQGYVVLMSIPFRSLRFDAGTKQTWRILFLREIPGRSEKSFWPYITNRVEGRLQQASLLTGLEDISPGRNIQAIPFGVFRSFRSLDQESTTPRFSSDLADADAGLDAKLVLKDQLVLDLAFNPDFSQVESDEPQVTVNRRFEVFFPERRPFFLENSQYFQTPLNLVFTRRIADPSIGARLTGKVGPYAVGAVLIDDESPGRQNSPSGDRAFFGIFRVNRDILNQSSIGMIYTDRELGDEYNRVAGFDGRFKLNENWVSTFQAVTSRSRLSDGVERAGPAYEAELERKGRHLELETRYQDISPGFLTRTGFISRRDIRSFSQEGKYFFRPEEGILLAFGPEIESSAIWDQQGTRLDTEFNPGFTLEFKGQTRTGFFYATGRERLRPQDIEDLVLNRDYSVNRRGFWMETSYLQWLTLKTMIRRSTRINFVPLAGEAPELATEWGGDLQLTLRPTTQLRIDNVYLFSRVTDRLDGASIFNNHIARSAWNWQFNREFSLRVIFQYDATLANPARTRLATGKNINTDFLATYRVNPWTVLFVGYNGNYQPQDLIPGLTNPAVLANSGFLNDSRQFFVKFSYLLRF